MRTHNIPSYKRKSKRYPYYAPWPGSIINPQWLERPLSRTNFHSPKGVRAIEILLYDLHHDDVRGDGLRPPHGTIPAAVKMMKFLLVRSFGNKDHIKNIKIVNSVLLSLFMAVMKCASPA